MPYAVVLVALDDAPHVRLLGNVLNRAHDEVAIGDRVRVVFEEVTDPESGELLRIPQWEVARVTAKALASSASATSPASSPARAPRSGSPRSAPR